jgi:hypothetical protein
MSGLSISVQAGPIQTKWVSFTTYKKYTHLVLCGLFVGFRALLFLRGPESFYLDKFRVSSVLRRRADEERRHTNTYYRQHYCWVDHTYDFTNALCKIFSWMTPPFAGNRESSRPTIEKKVKKSLCWRWCSTESPESSEFLAWIRRDRDRGKEVYLIFLNQGRRSFFCFAFSLLVYPSLPTD